jgi:hypothetical protein
MAIGLVGLLAGSMIGCGQGAEPVPPGAQLVHLVATQSEVRLDPATVHAGDVYLELDEPVDGSFAFVELKRTAEETPGPLSDNDLERLAHGDTEGTSIASYGVVCDPAQRPKDRGKLARPGGCGNVWRFVLVEGKYAILGPGWVEQAREASVDPTADPAGFVPPPTMAVLNVLP